MGIDFVIKGSLSYGDIAHERLLMSKYVKI